MKRGRTEAENFEAVHAAYSTRLYAYVRTRWQERGGIAADDICQEVWLRFREKGAAQSENSEVLPWLFRVAINLIIDLRRKAPPQPLTAGAEPVASGSAIETDLHRQEEAAKLADCLKRLEARDTQTGALVRALLGGEDYAAVRQRFNLAANRASEMKTMAVQWLRQCVGN